MGISEKKVFQSTGNSNCKASIGYLRTLASCSADLYLCIDNYFDNNILRTPLAEKITYFVVCQLKKIVAGN